MIRIPGYARRLLHSARLRVKPLSIGVRGVVENDAGHILLVRHTYVAGWHFPGGGVNTGETAQQALFREIREETGILPDAPLQLLGIYLNSSFHRRDHVLLYRCRNWRQMEPFRPNFEIAQTEFFAIDRLPPDISHGTARRIGEIYKNSPIAPEW
jgi:mutator protein MutT